jgi:hypothetical protein
MKRLRPGWDHGLLFEISCLNREAERLIEVGHGIGYKQVPQIQDI